MPGDDQEVLLEVAIHHPVDFHFLGFSLFLMQIQYYYIALFCNIVRFHCPGFAHQLCICPNCYPQAYQILLSFQQ